MKLFFTSVFLLFSISMLSQKKVLDHSDVELWNTIDDEAISPNGNLVVYNLQHENSDSHLILKDASRITSYNVCYTKLLRIN